MRCQEQLDALPASPKLDASAEILKLVNEFSQELNEIVLGNHDEKFLVHQNRLYYKKFGSQIRGTAPNFNPYESETCVCVYEMAPERANGIVPAIEDSE